MLCSFIIRYKTAQKASHFILVQSQVLYREIKKIRTVRPRNGWISSNLCLFVFFVRMPSQHEITLAGLLPTYILQLHYMANKNMKIKNMTRDMFWINRSMLETAWCLFYYWVCNGSSNNSVCCNLSWFLERMIKISYP